LRPLTNIFLFLALFSLPCAASIFGTPVTAANSSTSTSTTIAASALNTAAGDLVVVVARAGSNVTINSTADTAGNVYTPLTAQANGGNGGLRLFYTLNATANAANVVTVTYSATNTFRFIYVWDIPVSGGLAKFDVEGGALSTSSVSTLTSSNFSTTGTDEIVLVAVTMGATSRTAAISQSGYSLDSSSVNSGGFGGSAHGIFASPQAGTNVTMTWTGGAAPSSEIVAGAFKAIGGVARRR
jgi:hypothetical protein